VFSVPSLDEAERFYTAFGLAVRRSGNTLELCTFGTPHSWAVVHATGAPKKLEYVTYGVFADDLERFEARVAKAGIGAAPNSMSDGKGLWLTDPTESRFSY
jgi:catechol 2,3-dioxygenase-like lactoylglutathione lyase family enzyme